MPRIVRPVGASDMRGRFHQAKYFRGRKVEHPASHIGEALETSNDRTTGFVLVVGFRSGKAESLEFSDEGGFRLLVLWIIPFLALYNGDPVWDAFHEALDFENLL